VIKENLKILRQLQEIELAIKELQYEMDSIPQQMQRIDYKIEELRRLLEEEKKNEELSQKKRRQLEANLEDLQNQRSKYKEQLLQVKTNKEYQAMLREIENIEEEISQKETQILIEFEKQDEIGERIKETEQNSIQQKLIGDKEKEKLNQKMKELEEECQKLMKHKSFYEDKLPKDLLDTYNRIKLVRDGIALAEVRDSICQVCYVRLPPQFFNDIKANKRLFTCSNCNRILYFKREEERVS